MSVFPVNLAVSERAVLRLVQSRQATSQVQIARQLGVSTATVHNVVKRLLEQRIVEQASVDRGQKGRPLLHYRLRLPAPVVSIQWLGTEWHGAVIHPDPERDRAVGWATEKIPDPRRAVEMIAERASELLSDAGLERGEAAGCVVSVNAPRAKGNGRMTSSVIPWASDLDLTAVETALGCQAWLVAASGLAEAELAIRAEEGIRRLVVFNVGDGVSAHGCCHADSGPGVEMLRGEIGHIIVAPRGAVCGCGHRGCLETVLSGPAMQQRVREDGKSGMRTALEAAVKQSPRAFFDLLERLYVERTDSYAMTVAEEYLDWCAWALSVIVSTQNPEIIVLGGYGLVGRAAWTDRIRELAPSKILNGEQTTLRLEFPRSTPLDHLRRLAEGAFLSQSTS